MWLCVSCLAARSVTHDLVNSSRSFHTDWASNKPMRILEGQQFTGLRAWDGQGNVDDARFVRCNFKSCSVATATAPDARLQLRNVQLISCGHQGCSLFTTV